MRILLLPLTRRQTLLYAQRLTQNESMKPSPWLTWITAKAQKTWSDWGKSDTKWKSKTASIGNRLLDKIDWEEYSLKTIQDPKTTTSENVPPSSELEADMRFPLCIQVGWEMEMLLPLLRR
jgi:Mitochondrial K+-H+ exchange-related